MLDGSRRAFAALLFLTAVNETMQVFGTFCSSPQTTEMFARERLSTLMKYVMLANVNAIGIAAFASWLARSVWPLIGGLFVVAELHFLYRHAAKAGSEPDAPPAPGQGMVGLGAHRLR